MSERKTLILKRSVLKSKATRFETYLNSEEINADILRERLQNIHSLLEEFTKVQFELLMDGESQDANDDELESFERVFYGLVAKATTRLRLMDSSNPPSSSKSELNIPKNSSINCKLPTLDVPKYEGVLSEWISFRDTFTALIDSNENLSNIEKFHYLKASLKGDASKILNSLPVNDVNYTIAWALLKERFENRKLLINNHMQLLFGLPTLKAESTKGLHDFIDNIQINMRALKALDLPTDHWDTPIMYLLVNKLDNITRLEWEKVSSSTVVPTVKQFLSFLSDRSHILDSIPTSVNKGKQTFTSVENNNFISRNTKINCISCGGENHFVNKCSEFIAKSCEDKINLIKKLKCCYNCLRLGHSARNCRSQNSCMKCKGRHHTIIHADNRTKTNPVQQSIVTTAISEHHDSVTLLSTVIVKVLDKNGEPLTARALLDQGSQSNFVTTELANRLGINKLSADVSIVGIAGSSKTIDSKLNISISSMYSNYNENISCYVLNEITPSIPAETLHVQRSSLKKIKLADPEFYEPATIDMLLGSGVFWSCLKMQRKRCGDIQLQNTAFGWVITHINEQRTSNKKGISLFSCEESRQLHNRMERFWELEEGSSDSVQTIEEGEVEAHFMDTHTRDEQGRFIVELPLKERISVLGSSINMAHKRWNAVERRLLSSPDLKSQYDDFLEEYLALGHMSQVEHDEEVPSNYVPHHSVLKESSTTTKLRVVFDASAKTTSGLSLNSILKVGPNVQQDLFSIVTRFRTHKYVIAADIEKMFRQIHIHPDQRDLQRIVWKKPNDNHVSHFRLNTVTYGTASATYLSTRCLRQLGLLAQTSAPDASTSILRDFYVDDLLTGSNDYNIALKLRYEISRILESGGFNLRKWQSNCPSLISDDTSNAPEVKNLTESNQNVTSCTLGISWQCTKDVFNYNTSHIATRTATTKRQILSTISQLFDPLGLITPITILAKMFMQKIWQLKTDWDVDVPAELLSDWRVFQSQLVDIEKITIPRHVPRYENSELHGFSDSSETAYGACVYIRTMVNGTYTCNLLCARSRVAPLKTISLPRLELSAALLLAELMQRIIKCIDFSGPTYYWSDSTITLAWIAAPPLKWKTFVANRVSEIQHKSKGGIWKHVSTAFNPADIVSRGALPRDLSDNTLWWKGPEWLAQTNPDWEFPSDYPTEIPEERTNQKTFIVQKIEQDIFKKFSTLRKLERIICYCLRFKTNTCKKDPSVFGSISVNELRQARWLLIRLVQHSSFPEEIQALQRGRPIKSTSKLLTLHPFLDENNIIRVGGRLVNADIDFDKKHPVLLPSEHIYTSLVITHFHRELLHAGPQALLATIRNEFWILKGRQTVRGVLRKCVVCFKTHPTTIKALMGNLPLERIQPTRPFLVTGVDYAGPFHIKSGSLRSKALCKAYICIFVCFSTKAVHLDLAVDLSTQSFIKCFKRFVSRRGHCKKIYSDNATNFVGTSIELKKLNSFLADSNTTFSDFFATNSTEWNFIPAQSPHVGGLWEAAVKSAKRHLIKVMGQASLTYEELYTILTQVEACLNSRPLTPLSSDPCDLEALTPAHFLIGEPLVATSQLHVEPGISLRSRYERLTQSVQRFWKLWSNDYLSQLQERGKWKTTHPTDLAVGSLVIVKDDNLAPTHWRMARITQLHPGGDGVVRVVSIQTKTSSTKRAVNRLCLLPVK